MNPLHALMNLIHGNHPAAPAVLKHVGNAAAGAATGIAGTVGGALGSDPQRSTVPAYSYGKKNTDFGTAFDIASKPGSIIARAENSGVKALQSLFQQSHVQPMTRGALPMDEKSMQPMALRKILPEPGGSGPAQIQLRGSMGPQYSQSSNFSTPIQGMQNPGFTPMQGGNANHLLQSSVAKMPMIRIR